MTFTNGRADQTNYSTCKMLRHRQAPSVNGMIFESPDVAIGGAGEACAYGCTCAHKCYLCGNGEMRPFVAPLVSTAS